MKIIHRFTRCEGRLIGIDSIDDEVIFIIETTLFKILTVKKIIQVNAMKFNDDYDLLWEVPEQ
jgi:hypothetical protein